MYTAQIQRKFSNAPYNSKSFTIIKSNHNKSNVGFCREGKTGVPVLSVFLMGI